MQTLLKNTENNSTKTWQSDNISRKILEIEKKEKTGKLKFVSFEEWYYNWINHLKKIFSK